MARLTSLVLLTALCRLHALGATQECAGDIFLNGSGFVDDECLLRMVVDMSHCGFEVTPDVEILDDHLTWWNCSHVVNPTPTRFELLCSYANNPSPSPSFSPSPFSPSPFSPSPLSPLSPSPSPSTSSSPTPSSPTPAAQRRLVASPSPSPSSSPTPSSPTPAPPTPFPTFYWEADDNKVIRWTARRVAIVDECSATIGNLTRRIDELEEDLATCRTTETTTATAGAVAVASAGLATECASYLPFLIASLALNGLLILLVACQHLRMRKPAPVPEQGQAMVRQVEAAPPASEPVWEFNAEEAGNPVREVEADVQAGAVSRGTDLSGVSGTIGAATQDAGGVRSGAQQSSDTWAGRSIIYRYIRQTSRAGNEIQATARRGWRMNAQEPPSMENLDSAATSRAPSGIASREAARSTKTVQFASEGGRVGGGAGAGATGARGSAEPATLEEYQV